MGDKESHKIILSISNGNMKIYTENITFGSGEETIDVEYKGENIQIALNYTFVTEVLNVFSKDDVIIEFKDTQSTITIKEKGKDDYLYIMMPMSV
jgi:DNA polymerase III subunit beta